MKIVVAGGTGFLGRPLCAALVKSGHEVIVLTRGPFGRTPTGRAVTWNPEAPEASWLKEVDGADVVMNLSGESIADGRWTSARKEALLHSRTVSTRALVAAVQAAGRRPSVFIGGSGVGYYGSTGDAILDESSPAGTDFLARLGVEWEAEAQAAATLGCRVAIIRTGIALHRSGGALAKLVTPFLLFAGGPISSGRQYMSWIHRDDWVRLVAWTATESSVSGPVNATAPEPVTNEEFSRALGRALHRPSWLRVPALPLRIALGEMADVALVNGQRAIPRRALEAGFVFKYPSIDAAMESALAND
jgi:uncharacterized protein (TIGR01777 family)